MLLVTHPLQLVRLGYLKWRQHGVPQVSTRMLRMIFGLIRNLLQVILKEVYAFAAGADASLVD